MHQHTRTDPGRRSPRKTLSRRQFLTAATGLTATALAAPAALAYPSAGVYVDSTADWPTPGVRIVHAALYPRPADWPGWPGTGFDVEALCRRHARLFAEAARRTGIELDQHATALADDMSVAAFTDQLRTHPPHAVLVSLQHFDAWPWASRIASAGVPSVVFAPVGPGFGTCVRSIAPVPGVHVIAAPDIDPVERAFRLVRAKRQLEATRLLAVGHGGDCDERMEGTGLTLRHISNSRFRRYCANTRTRGRGLDTAIRELLAKEECHGLVLGDRAEIHTALSLCLVRYAFGEGAEPGVLDPQAESANRVRRHCTWEDGQPVTLTQFCAPHRLLAVNGTIAAGATAFREATRRSCVEVQDSAAFDMPHSPAFRPIVFRGSHRTDLEAFCRLYGFECVDSPDVEA